MVKVLMTPAPGARDDNGVGNVIYNYALHAEKYGIEFVNLGDEFDVEIAHAGVKDFENPAGNNIAMLHGLYWGDEVLNGEQLMANRNIVQSIRQAKAVTVPSSWVAETLKRDMHLTPHVIPHGINLDDWQGGKRTGHVVLWAKNRSDAVCDPRWAVDLARAFPDIRFVSTFGRALENMAVVGALPRDTMQAVIKTSSIYLSTAKETFGVTTLEALASGAPVLGFNWGGNVDIVQTGVNGYLAKPNDLDDLARGLVYCLENWQELSKGALTTAESWTWTNVMGRLSTLIHEVAKDKAPKFAIVIPCYNKRDTILEAVQSALDQSVACEVIVVDDGSTDGSASVINDPNVKVISQENRGVAHARNVGIAATNADFIACLDGDDSIAKDFIQACYSAMSKDNAIGVAFTGITQVHPDGHMTPSPWPNGFDYERQMAQANQVPTCALFRREAWERLGGYRQRYAPHGAGAEDAEFWLRVGAIGYKIVQATTQGLFRYRIHGGATHTGYREYPWLSWHPWTEDKRHPFASIARPENVAHPVPVYDEPGVSVIIPVGPGHSPHLINALDSLEAQTFRNWEAIVVFDGEEPALPHESGIKAFKKAYPYTRAFVTKNRGAGAARNLGMSMARAPLLYFLDADDWLDPSCLEKHIAVYMQTGGAVYSDYFGINPPDIKETEVILKQEPDRTVVHGQLPSYDCQLAQKQPDPDRPYAWCAINTLIPANLIGSVKFDESLPSLEDWEFFISLAKNGVCFHKIPEPLWVYNFHLGRRRSEGQLDRKSVINMFKENNVMTKCNGCGGNKDAVAPPPTSMSVGEGPEGYLWATYVPQTAGKHPVWGVVKPKINYGMKQQGQQFWVHQGDAALTGKFVCGHCGRPFQVNVREQKARCPCPGASSAQPVIDTVQRATGATPAPQAKQLQPVRVTPQSVTAPVATVREEADRPIPVQQVEPDNFETIAGVGPATNKKLHDAGVKTFTQLGRVDRGYLSVLGIPPNAISAIMNHIEAADG